MAQPSASLALPARPPAPPPAPPPPAPPPAAPPHAAAASAQVPGPGLGPIDPLSIPTPPELAGPIYSHIRRLALQADLAGGDRVLRDALAELTSSLSCAVVYPGQDGLWTLGSDDEIPRDAQPLIAVATARRAVIASHLALVPVVTSTEVVAVIALSRNPRQPAYQLIEQVAMVALAREAAPILHHLAVQHLQRASEIKADKGSLYRGEALEAHRTRGQEGTLVQLSPDWVKRAYPILVVAMVIAIGFAVFIRVPTYSSGTAVVVFEGSTSVTATASGTVEKVLVHENQPVKRGDPLLRLGSPEEAAQLTAAETEWRDTEIQFLFDQTDPQISKALKSAATARDHALARVEARTIRAPRDGVVTNLHVKEGTAVQLGSYLLQITDENSEIEVLAFVPSKDGPRIRRTMELQLELEGYTKARAIAKISHVQPDAVSASEIAKLGGDMLAESIAKELSAGTPGTWIAVRARLPTRTFRTDHRTYRYHHGMHAKVEIKIQSKPFLVTLLPALENYLPD
jgi:membrane fusion protein (multidrug efflux system)